jgi:CDP-diacylglycerol--glycerol-3-phosphate 3-phosphatidyltransferase
MNLPNQLTLARIGLTGLLAICLTVPAIPCRKTLAMVIFMMAGLTDYLDGKLARSRNLISAFGQLMDPVADKILVCAAFVSFVALDQIVPAWMVIVIISREFVVTGVRLLAIRDGTVISAGAWGKQKMIWQTLLIIAILVGLALRDELFPWLLSADGLSRIQPVFNPIFEWSVWGFALAVTLLTLVSGLAYLWDNRTLLTRDV